MRCLNYKPEDVVQYAIQFIQQNKERLQTGQILFKKADYDINLDYLNMCVNPMTEKVLLHCLNEMPSVDNLCDTITGFMKANETMLNQALNAAKGAVSGKRSGKP